MSHADDGFIPWDYVSVGVHAVCFDLDGTLLHFTRPYAEVLRDTFRDVLGESRAEWLEAYDEAFYRRFQACEPRPVERGFAEAVPDADSEDLTDALLQREIEMIEPAPGIQELLESLHADDIQVGVVTNGVPHWQRAKLDAHGILDQVDAFVASYEADAHKPDPAPFHLAESRLDATEFLIIGDDDADIDGATNADWRSSRYEGQGFHDFQIDLTA